MKNKSKIRFQDLHLFTFRQKTKLNDAERLYLEFFGKYHNNLDKTYTLAESDVYYTELYIKKFS